MQKKTDVLIIGGGPAGVISAITAKQFYPDKNILLLKSIEHGCIPCGIPYMLSSLKNPEDNKMGDAPLEKNGIEFVVEEATKIDRETFNLIICRIVLSSASMSINRL